MQDDQIAVTQADREQAAAVIDTYEGKERYAVPVRAGNRDGHWLCLAFARHRQQAENAMRERCAVIAIDHGNNHDTDSHAESALAIATAIRAATLSKEGE